jgi:hypothetical protein
MQKRTKNILAIAAVAGVGYLIYNQYQKKSFANLTKYPVGCKVYSGSVNAAVGSVITNWVDGGGKEGIIVKTDRFSTVVCPRGTTSDLPVSATPNIRQSTISR